MYVNLFISTEPGDEIRLVNGEQTGGSSGRVEVLVKGEWGTICQDGLADPYYPDGIWVKGRRAARVICRSLGYSDGKYIPTPEHNHGWARSKMVNLDCYGGEPSVFDCSSRLLPNICIFDEPFSVSCS